MSEDSAPSTQLSKGEYRYLWRSLFVLYVVFAILNGVTCRLFIGWHASSPTRSLYRDTYQSKALARWPSTTPGFSRWPRVEKSAIFESPNSFVREIYAVAWDANQKKHVMDSVFVGRPFPVFEIKETRITLNGRVLHAKPPIGVAPSIRWNPLGLIVSPLIYALGVWIFIGISPLYLILLNRRDRYRKWARVALCPVCSYDIKDLPICPECGTPAKAP